MTLIGDFVTGQTVAFQRMRALMQTLALQEGVVGATDLQVIQRAAGANMSVDVGAGDAWVQIDTGTRNGLAHVYNDSAANVVVSSSNATNPRVDQIVLRYNDPSIPTGTGTVPTLEVLTGTATAGATLDNRSGALSLPNDCLRLADVLVPATSTSVTTANIRDRRPWARGAYWRMDGNNAAAIQTTNATMTAMGQFDTRLELTGVPIEVEFTGRAWNTVAAAACVIAPTADGVEVTTGGVTFRSIVVSDTASQTKPFHMVARYTPASPGSKLMGVALLASSGGTASIANSASEVPHFVVRELVRPSAANQ